MSGILNEIDVGFYTIMRERICFTRLLVPDLEVTARMEQTCNDLTHSAEFAGPPDQPR